MSSKLAGVSAFSKNIFFRVFVAKSQLMQIKQNLKPWLRYTETGFKSIFNDSNKDGRLILTDSKIILAVKTDNSEKYHHVKKNKDHSFTIFTFYFNFEQNCQIKILKLDPL